MTPVAHQAPLSMKFSRQEYCSGLPFPTPGDLPDTAIESVSPAPLALAGRCFTPEPLGKPSPSVSKQLKMGYFDRLCTELAAKGKAKKKKRKQPNSSFPKISDGMFTFSQALKTSGNP